MDESSFIHVKVGGVSALRDIIGKERLVDLKRGGTVCDLINSLDEKFGSAYMQMIGEGLAYALRKRFNMILNGVVTAPAANLETVLNDGDEVVFFQLAGA